MSNFLYFMLKLISYVKIKLKCWIEYARLNNTYRNISSVWKKQKNKDIKSILSTHNKIGKHAIVPYLSK